MSDQKSSAFFNRARAASYDEKRAKLAPMRDALHLMMQMVLAELPVDARILCVGAGTGLELITLAQAFPAWQFTAVDPAAPMLDICRQQAEAHGIAARCTFHPGYLDSLPESEPFDAATCILVSHFLTKPGERHNFFREIAARLRPGGYLISADLASDTSSSAFNSLLDVWERAMAYADMPIDRAYFGRKLAILPPHEVETLIASSGFDTPVLFFQSLFIHAWYATRTT